MKQKKYIYFLILFVFSIWIMVPAIQSGYIRGHDTNFHVANISAIVDQLSWNNLLVQEPLAQIANNFGYGTRFFYPPLPHLSAAYTTKFLTLFSINDVTIGMRITQWLGFLASGITFFLLAYKIFQNKKVALLTSLFYMSAPYHLSQVFIRDAFSEMFIPIAIPLIVLGLIYLTENNRKKFFFYFVGGYTLAIYSHMAMSIYFTLILVVSFLPIFWKKLITKKNILSLLLAAITILGLTASFWIPMLEIKLKGSYGAFMPYFMTGKGDLRFSTLSILELINYTKPHTYDFIRYHLPLFVTILFFLSIFYFLRKKLWKEKVATFLLCFTILSIIMITPLFPWYYTPDILQTLQFPWRLCIYIAFGAILFSGIYLKQLEHRKEFRVLAIVLIGLTFFSSYYYTYHLNAEKVNIHEINYNLGVGNQSEYLPEKTLNNMEYYKNRTADIISLSGSGKSTMILNEVPTLIFDVKEVDNTMKLELPRLYYMGYQLKKGSEEIPLEQSENGFLQATIQKNGRYVLTYKKTIAMKIANTISLLSFVSLVIISWKQKKKVFK